MWDRLRLLFRERLSTWRPSEDPLGFDPFDDPSTGVRVPRPFGTGGRSSAIAVPEPEPFQEVRAMARESQTPR